MQWLAIDFQIRPPKPQATPRHILDTAPRMKKKSTRIKTHLMYILLFFLYAIPHEGLNEATLRTTLCIGSLPRALCITSSRALSAPGPQQPPQGGLLLE